MTNELTAWLEDHPHGALWLELLAAALIGVVVHAVVAVALRRMSQRYGLAERLVGYSHRAGQFLFPVLLMQAAVSDDSVAPRWLHHALSIAVVALVTVLCIQLVQALADKTLADNPLASSEDVNRARRLQTQVRVFARSAMFVIGLLGVGLALMTFPNVRQVGASLLASAGVAGIVMGFAARPVLSNFIAGLQIALTQPVRIGDELIVENEWGRVEEITGTYVVLCIWDQRRLIVPLEWFTSKPFQNWTRASPELLGSVMLWVDCRMPVEPLREELTRLCQASSLWDRRVCVLQVTDVSERAMQLRALVSAGDAGRTWDVRCEVREGLIAFMQQHYPQWLPSVRVTVTMPPGQDPASALQAPEPSREGWVAAPAR